MTGSYRSAGQDYRLVSTGDVSLTNPPSQSFLQSLTFFFIVIFNSLFLSIYYPVMLVYAHYIFLCELNVSIWIIFKQALYA